MAKIIVEFEPPTSQKQVRALQEIIHLNPSKRGHEPVVRGGIIICGRLTLKDVVKKLQSAGITVSKVFIPRGFGAEQTLVVSYQLTIARDKPIVSESVDGAIVGGTTLKGEGMSITGVPDKKESLDLHELEYWQSLSGLSEKRATALHDALSMVSTAANDLCPREGVRLQPYHLVDLPSGNDDLETNNSISLRSLDKACPDLSKSIWDYVHHFERVKRDVPDMQEALINATLGVLMNDEVCDGLFALAARDTPVGLGHSGTIFP